MKARAERLTANAVKELQKVLETQLEDIASIVTEMEETHSLAEMAIDANYCALVSAALGLQQVAEGIEYWINRGGTPATKKDEK